MKIKWIYTLAGLVIFLLCIPFFTNNASATEVWSDDFETDLGDWTILGYNSTDLSSIAGNFSIADGMLTSLDDDINIARHDSTVSVGTWSFDMFVPDDDDGTGSIDVMFMSNGSRPYPQYASLTISFEAWYNENRFDLWEIRGLNDAALLDYFVPSGIEGWWNVIITRTSGGEFSIYLNETLRMSVVNNDVTSSTYLEFFCANATGAAIDNLVVDDEVWEPTTTPTPTPLPWDLIAIGGGVAVVVIVLLILIIKRR
ncbi:MAG: hypothetical protein RTV31_04535 [Candidatus Thorarchaeota archaeon]